MINKNIFILFKDSFPEGMASTSRVHNYCKILKKIGCNVTVGCLNVNDDIEDIDHVDELISIEKLTNQRKLFNSISNIIDERKDIIDSVIVYGFSSYVQRNLIRTFREHIKFYYELNELPFSFKASRRDYIPFLNSIKRWWLLKTTFPLYDGMICISKSLKDLADNYTKPESKNIIIPILTDTESIKQKEANCDNFPPYIFHAGYLNEQKDGIIEVFKAFAIASRKYPELEFWLTTRKAEKRTLKKIDSIIIENKLHDRVVFLGFISKEEIWEKLNCAKAVVVCKPDNPQNRHNFPTKIAEYAKVGVPLIYAGVGEAVNYLEMNNNAILVQINPEKMGEAIINLLQDDTLHRKLSKGIRELGHDKFNYSNYKQEFHEMFYEGSSKKSI